jgi:hypothetical protein
MSTPATKLPPLQRSIIVPLSVPAAFDLFVRRLPEWWPLATRSVWLREAASCHVEPRLGGRLFERSTRGEESLWGEIRRFDEPSAVVFSWHPGLPPQAGTEVEVRFEAVHGSSDFTRVLLEHRDWERLGERASFVRGLFEGGWGPVLERFVAAARGDHELPPVVGPGCIQRS